MLTCYCRNPLMLCLFPQAKPHNGSRIGLQHTLRGRDERGIWQGLAVALGGWTRVARRSGPGSDRVLVSWDLLGWGRPWFWAAVDQHDGYVHHGVGDGWRAAAGMLLGQWRGVSCSGLAHVWGGVAGDLEVTGSCTQRHLAKAVEARGRAGWAFQGSRR